MADPLCRWHYALPKNVVEIVRVLPKTELTKDEFLHDVRSALAKGDFSFDFETFQKTAYQLAVQLGLYYIDDAEVYHPRFDHDITEETAAQYLRVVAQSYVAPNPYTNTKSFGDGQQPINLYSALIGFASALPNGSSFDVNDALKEHFSAELGNPDAVTALMAAAPSFTKVGSKTLSYSPVQAKPMTREGFFKLIPWQCPSETSLDSGIANLDKLSIAVREFKAHRTDADWSKTDCPASQMMAYQAVNTGIREYFGKLTVAKVAAFGLAELTELFTGVKGPDGKVVFEPMWSGKIGQGRKLIGFSRTS